MKVFNCFHSNFRSKRLSGFGVTDKQIINLLSQTFSFVLLKRIVSALNLFTFYSVSEKLLKDLSNLELLTKKYQMLETTHTFFFNCFNTE